MKDFYLGGPQPVPRSRYEQAKRDLVGGALFAIALGLVGALVLVGWL